MNPFLQAFGTPLPPPKPKEFEQRLNTQGLEGMLQNLFRQDLQQLLLPQNQVAEGSGVLRAPEFFTMEATKPPKEWGAFEPKHPHAFTRMGLPQPVSILTDEQYAKLIQELIGTAVRR